MTGETLTGTEHPPALPCYPFAYNVSGTATGAYPGVFTEQGNFPDLSRPSITFSITAADGTPITGVKQFDQGTSGLAIGYTCTNGTFTHASFTYTALTYTATIHTPSGNYQDTGTSDLHVIYDSTIGLTTLTETYTSSLSQPVLIVPTSKAQCKNGGYQNYPQFADQGTCITYVNEHS